MTVSLSSLQIQNNVEDEMQLLLHCPEYDSSRANFSDINPDSPVNSLSYNLKIMSLRLALVALP